MATLVGTQSNFSKAIQELTELDFDAVEAYEAAINRIQNKTYKEYLAKFKADHERHIKSLNEALSKHDFDIIEGPSAKKYLTQGKVVMANMMGDKAIVNAMISNEEDTNTAYERVNQYEEKWPDIVNVLKKGLEDEKNHKKWLEDNKHLLN